MALRIYVHVVSIDESHRMVGRHLGSGTRYIRGVSSLEQLASDSGRIRNKKYKDRNSDI
jgi:hypothetical protein